MPLPDLNESLGLRQFGALRRIGQERRSRPRLKLTDDLPADFEETLRGRLRTLPAEDIEESPSGAVQYALEALDLPRNAIANLVNQFVGAEPSSKTRAFGLRKVGAGDILRKLGLSATGRHTGATGEGATGGGSTGGKIADFLAGFIGDVALDPLTWLTGGTSRLVGSGARAAGGKLFTKAGAQRVAQTADELGKTQSLARLGPGFASTTDNVRKNAAALHAQAALPSTDLGRASLEALDKGMRTDRAAAAVAREAPELLDRNLIGLTTRGAREFSPLGLPAMLATGLAHLTLPLAGEGGRAAARGIGKALDTATRYTRPMAFLPEKDVTLATTALAEKLGLSKLGPALNKLPVIGAIGRGLSDAGREARKLISTEPLPPKAGDANDLERFRAESLSQEANRLMMSRARERAFDEHRYQTEQYAKIAQRTGATPEQVRQATYVMREGESSAEAGARSRRQIADEAQRAAIDAGASPEVAARLVSFVEANPEELRAAAEAAEQARRAALPRVELQPERVEVGTWEGGNVGTGALPAPPPSRVQPLGQLPEFGPGDRLVAGSTQTGATKPGPRNLKESRAEAEGRIAELWQSHGAMVEKPPALGVDVTGAPIEIPFPLLYDPRSKQSKSWMRELREQFGAEAGFLVKQRRRGERGETIEDLASKHGWDNVISAVNARLADTPAGRARGLIELSQKRPELFSPEQLHTLHRFTALSTVGMTKEAKRALAKAQPASINVDELAVGDKFTVAGDPHRVEDIDPDTGAVRVKDGIISDVEAGHEIPIDAGSLKRPGELGVPGFEGTPGVGPNARQQPLIEPQYGVETPAGADRAGVVARMAEKDFVTAAAERAAQRAPYFDSAGQRIASSRETPTEGYPFKVGQWRISEARGSYGRDVDELVELDPAQLSISEDDFTKVNYEGRGDDAERYAEWMRSGKRPPPIEVVQTDGGELKVTDGHRRLAAAKKAGQPVLAWVSWRMPTGKIGSDGKPIYTGLTYEGAAKQSASSAPPLRPDRPLFGAPFSDELAETLQRVAGELPDDADATQILRAIYKVTDDQKQRVYTSAALSKMLAAGGVRREAGRRELVSAFKSIKAGEFTPEKRAAAVLSGLGHKDLSELPAVEWGDGAAVTAENVEQFLRHNEPLRQWFIKHLSPQRQFEMTGRELAERVEAVRKLAGPGATGWKPVPQLPGTAGRLEVEGGIREVLDHLQTADVTRMARFAERGIPQPALSTESKIAYVERILGKAKTRSGDLFRKGGMTIKSGLQKMRTWEREKLASELNREIDLVNAYQTGGGGDSKAIELAESLGLKDGETIPRIELDLVLSTIHREIEAERTIGSAEFFEEAAKRFGVRINKAGDLPQGLEQLRSKGRFGDIAREYAFRPEVVKVLEAHAGQLERPNKILSGYRWLLNHWKGLALISGGYHLNNKFGNVWNSALLDGWSAEGEEIGRRVLKAVVDAAAPQNRQVAGATDRLIAGATKSPLDAPLPGVPGQTLGSFYRQMFADGAVGTGLFGQELRASPDRVRDIIDALRNPPALKNAWARLRQGNITGANALLGEVGDYTSRIAFVYTRMRRGDTFEQATEKMRLALFDYSKLTTFERGTLNRPGLRDIVPFYSFTKNQAKLLLRMALSSPDKLAMFPKLQLNIENAAAGEETLPPSMRPAHIQAEGGVQISGGTRPLFRGLGNMLPVGELALVNPLNPRGAFKRAIASAGGPLKTAYELATNQDTYFDRPIREYPGQTKDFLGMKVMPETKHVLRTLRPLNLVEQGMNLAEAAGSPLEAVANVAGHVAGVRTFSVDAARQVFEAERDLNERISGVRRDLKRRLVDVERAGGGVAGDAELSRLLTIHEELKARRDALPRAEARAGGAAERKSRIQKFEEFLQAARERMLAPTG